MRPTEHSLSFAHSPNPTAGHVGRRQFLQWTAAAGAVAGWNLTAGPSLAVEHNVSWLNEVQRPPTNPAEGAPQPEPLFPASAHPTLADWQARRTALRDSWLKYLNPWYSLDKIPTPQVQVLEQDRVGDVVRKLLRYEAEPGVTNEAYLLEPAGGAAKKRPGVVAMHSTVDHSIRQPAGVEGKPEKAFGMKLAQAGCVAICPRNFLWPDNHHIAAQSETRRFHDRHPQSKGMAKMLYDAVQAVNLLLAHAQVDPERIGCVGHSLGAKEAIYLAAFDERVAVTVSSEGGISTTFSNWDAPWYLGPEIREFGHEHHELLALAAPRPFLLVGGDSADGAASWPLIEAALPVWKLYAESQPPRLGLLNHQQGHAVPPIAERRIHEWLTTYLQV